MEMQDIGRQLLEADLRDELEKARDDREIASMSVAKYEAAVGLWTQVGDQEQARDANVGLIKARREQRQAEKMIEKISKTPSI